MANNIPVSNVISASLGLLEANSVLGRLVHRDAEAGFTGGVGDSVRVRLPSIIEARDGAGAETVFSDLDEGTATVELTHEAYSAVLLSDKELSFDLYDFGRQVLNPQAAGIARFAENAIAGILNDAVADSSHTVDPGNPLSAVARAAGEFTRREIGFEDRYVVIGPDLVEAFLTAEALQNSSASGDDSVIRGGRIGRVYGFDVWVSPYVNGMTAFTPEAFALACRAPEPPAGAGYAETQAHNGFALRYLRDFSVQHRSDASLMSTFVGATTLDANRYMAFEVGSGGGNGGGTQNVNIVGATATVPVDVTSQPIQVESVGDGVDGAAASTASTTTKATTTKPKAAKATKAKSAA